jgi:hypothetical protein
MTPVTLSDLLSRGYVLYPTTQGESYMIHREDLGAKTTQDLTRAVYVSKGSGPWRGAGKGSEASKRAVAYKVEQFKITCAMDREWGI